MITKMQKFTFLVTAQEYEPFLAQLREAGVAHIEQLQQGATSPEFEEGKQWAQRYKNALAALDEATTKTEPLAVAETSEDGRALVEQIEALLVSKASLLREKESTERQVAALEPWGEFAQENITRLAEQGWRVRFYVCPTKTLNPQWNAYVVSESGGKTYFVTVSHEDDDAVSAEPVSLPPHSLSYYREELARVTHETEKIQTSLQTINATGRKAIEAAQVENDNAISLSRVRLSSTPLAEDNVRMLVGWVPAEKSADLIQRLDADKIYYECEAPTLDDTVPVQIKNGKFSTLFEPILRMYSLPNYKDLDILPFMSPFFMLFFGLCMGDAGYGVLILAASAVLYGKLPAAQKGYGALGMLLGGMTIVCGLLTGTLFGIDLTQQDWAFLAAVKPYFINEANYTIWGYSPMMVISVIIGLIQVLFGMVLASVKASLLYGWQYGVGKMSWVVALLALIAAFGVPACGVALPVWLTYTLYAIIALSCVGIYFYNTPKKNIFLNFGTGLWNTYGMATGLLGDLLSYIRLFALGLTGGVLGSVFNSLAIDMTGSMNWAIRWLPMLLILLIGHGINFALCMISSFVHPMRLTFVEFFKNADFSGGGLEYDPFRVKTVNNQ